MPEHPSLCECAPNAVLVAVKKAADRFLIEKTATAEFALAGACAKADALVPIEAERV